MNPTSSAEYRGKGVITAAQAAATWLSTACWTSCRAASRVARALDSASDAAALSAAALSAAALPAAALSAAALSAAALSAASLVIRTVSTFSAAIWPAVLDLSSSVTTKSIAHESA